MRICYVDEAGCPGSLPGATSDVQPVFVVVGITLPQERLRQVTHGYLALKRRFFPGLARGRPMGFLDWVLPEVKGSDIRRDAALPSRRKWHPAIRFLGAVIRQLRDNDARILGRVWVKKPGRPTDPTAIYTFCVQSICRDFQALLVDEGTRGMIIADSRRPGQNSTVAHSVFTQMHRAGGDPFDRILEMPVFGHSHNHVGLQLADLLASALVFPLAVESYSKPHVSNVHTSRDYGRLKQAFGRELEALQFRYQDDQGRWRGGLVVSDPIAGRPGGHLFR